MFTSRFKRMDNMGNTYSAYTKSQLAYIRKQAMKTTGAKAVKHVIPRAYCVAKPGPFVALFATPWQDEQKKFRNHLLGSSCYVQHGADSINVGDWASIAYVQTVHTVISVAVPIPYAKSDARGWK